MGKLDLGLYTRQLKVCTLKFIVVELIEMPHIWMQAICDIFTIECSQCFFLSGGSKGVPRTPPPSKFFHFHPVFRKKVCKIIDWDTILKSWRPPREILDPPLFCVNMKTHLCLFISPYFCCISSCRALKYNNVHFFLILQRILFSLGGSFLHYANHFKLYSSFCASHSKAQKVLNPGIRIISLRSIFWNSSLWYIYSKSLSLTFLSILSHWQSSRFTKKVKLKATNSNGLWQFHNNWSLMSEDRGL